MERNSVGMGLLAHVIFIDRINPNTPKSIIDEHFRQYGEITNIVMPFDHFCQRYKGYAFVSYEKESSMVAAIAGKNQVS